MAHSSPHAHRLETLRAALAKADIDAAAVVPGANFYFLTGVHFHLMERPTILFVGADGSKHAIIPVLERSRWQASAPDVDTVYWQDSDGFEAAFAEAARRYVPRRIGVEGQRMRVFEGDALRRHFRNCDVVDAHAVISSARLCKDETEVAALRRAIDISEAALERTLAALTVGMSEVAIRKMLSSAMMDLGAEALAFDPIVLAGAAAADPHGTASEERKLAAGDALLFDFGAASGGYNADITRTVFVKRASDAHRAIYDSVLKANELGVKMTAPGVTLDSIDRSVTRRMQDDGYADLVLCKTGHGLGLDVHEGPQVMIGNKQKLEPGMVITIEPGLYRDGDVGVRIEDDVLVTPNGSESLTRFDRSLRIVG
jgi:Xaa-Pro dipeptidase